MPAVAPFTGNVARLRTQTGPAIDATHPAFGVVADGSTNDSAALQAALAYAASVGGGRVLLPRGTIRLATAIVWPDAAGVELVGWGRGQTLVKCDQQGSPATGAAIVFSSALGYSGARVADLTLYGPANSDASCYDGILVEDRVSDTLFENLELYHFRHAGIRYSSSSPGSRTLVRGCYFHDICTSGMTVIAGAAILGAYPYQKITDNWFVSVGNGSQFHAVYLGTQDYAQVSENHFVGTHSRLQFFGGTARGCTVNGNVFNGNTQVILQGCPDIAFVGNTLISTPLNLGSDRAVISGNTFYNPSALNDLLITGASSDRVLVIGNSFYQGAANDCILMDNGTGWVITGNDFTSASRSVVLSAGTYHVVHGNDFYGVSSSEQVYIPVAGAQHCAIYGNHFHLTRAGSTRPIYDDGASGTNQAFGNLCYAPSGSLDFGANIVNADHPYNNGAGGVRTFKATATWDPASLNDGVVEAKDVTLTGVLATDEISASLSTILGNNFQLTAHYKAADTVRCVLRNVSGGTVDLASGTVTVVARRFS